MTLKLKHTTKHINYCFLHNVQETKLTQNAVPATTTNIERTKCQSLLVPFRVGAE